MEDRYAFSELLLDKDNINKLIKKRVYHKTEEKNTITLLIMGHGRERYKEKFSREIEYYSDPFAFKVNQQDTNKTVRILSKAGKPKICAWDYNLCTKTMSSQDIIMELSHIFFSDENKEFNTLTIMNGLSAYFKTLYPDIIYKVSRNYRDLPEDKNPGSPDALDYEQRYNDFQKVLESLEENKFSDLKALNHEKIFTIRPDNEEEYKIPCEKYLFEIVELRTDESNEYIDFIVNHLKIRENLVKNYFEMTKEELRSYITNYTNSVYEIMYNLDIDKIYKYYLINFVFKIYFGHEIMLSEIVEFFVILGIETINIIDNTCRVQEKSRIDSSSVKTSEIEREERLNLAGRTYSKKRFNKKHRKTRKYIK
jgi:hypothetical protein